MSDDKVQKIYESTILGDEKKKQIEESRGGWMIGLIGDLEEAFNSDAAFYNGKYQDKGASMNATNYLEPKQHKAMIQALNNLVKAMQKGYKGKLIGF